MASVEKRVRDGNATWLARWRDSDGLQRKCSFPRRGEADRFLACVASDLARGTYIDPAAGRVTVEDWSTVWLAGLSHLKVTTFARYRGIVRLHVLPKWGRRRLSAVSHAEIAAWVTSLSDSGLSPGSVRYVHAVFSSMLAMAVRDEKLARNPAVGVRLPRVRAREPRFLTVEEVQALAAASGSDAGVIWFLALTGLRFGEMAALRVRRVNLAARRLVVAESVSEVSGDLVWSTPKNHLPRTVPLPRAVVDMLARACEGKSDDDLVFVAPRGGPLRINNWRPRVFDPACLAAGLSSVTPHDLRHAAASLAVSAGANVKAVQRMLGHASAAMTLDVYTGLFGDDLDAVAERLNAVVPPICPELRHGVTVDGCAPDVPRASTTR